MFGDYFKWFPAFGKHRKPRWFRNAYVLEFGFAHFIWFDPIGFVSHPVWSISSQFFGSNFAKNSRKTLRLDFVSHRHRGRRLHAIGPNYFEIPNIRGVWSDPSRWYPIYAEIISHRNCWNVENRRNQTYSVAGSIPDTRTLFKHWSQEHGPCWDQIIFGFKFVLHFLTLWIYCELVQ